MKKARIDQPEQPDTRPKQLSELLEQALRQPGVREFMAVYENWKALEDVTRPHRQAMGVKRIVSVSNTSGPMVRRII